MTGQGPAGFQAGEGWLAVFYLIFLISLPLSDKTEILSRRAIKTNAINHINGWMTCDFTSFSTVFQTYKDDERVILKGCVQWTPVLDETDLCLGWGSKPGLLDQSVGQQSYKILRQFQFVVLTKTICFMRENANLS